MAAPESPKRKKPAAKPGENMRPALEKAKTEAEAALARANEEEKAGLKIETELAKTQEALAATQAEVAEERQVRVETERALAEAREALDAAQAEIKKEHQGLAETKEVLANATEKLATAQAEVEQERQARKKAEQAKTEAERALREAKNITKTETATTERFSTMPEDEIGEQRVSFIVRVTADERWQPRRTEIQPAQSKKKETFPALDGQQLAAFIRAYLLSLKPTVPPTTPLATVKTPPPESSERAVSLTISDVQVFRIGLPGVSALIVKSNESFVVQSHFKLEGAEALSVTAQESSYEMQIHAHEVTKGKTSSLTTYQGNLVKGVLDYTAETQPTGLPPGLYRLFTLIILQAPTKLVGHHEGPVFQVGEIQQPVASAGSQEVVQPQ